jgi:DNA-binding IclR family transcriptional regulator
MALLSRLSPEQAQTLVDCRLTDHGEVMLADAVPWGRLALGVQAERHLPAHTGAAGVAAA